MTDDRDLTAFVAAECERLDVPGCAVGVIAGGTTYAVTYGVLDARHPRPVDEDTLFPIGSTSKTMTATTLMSLVDDGRVSLDDRVVEHLPELALRDAAAGRPCPSGNCSTTRPAGAVTSRRRPAGATMRSSRAVTEVAPTVPQVLPPGTTPSYNNLALVVAGRLVEVVSGRGTRRSCGSGCCSPRHDEHLLLPLGDGDPPHGHRPRVARGRDAAGVRWPMSRAMGPAGGAVSTVRDQLRYAQFHLDGTRAGRRRCRTRSGRRCSSPGWRCRRPVGDSALAGCWRERDGVRLVGHGGNCNNLLRLRLHAGAGASGSR